MNNWPALRNALQQHGLDVARQAEPRPVGGGSISAAWQVECDSGYVFLKTASPESVDMLEAEGAGLEQLRRTDEVRIPVVLASDAISEVSFLALEWLNLQPTDASVDRQFGQQLARLHRHSSERFGWHRDNTIGSTPQKNSWNDSWMEFFAERRLQFQLELAIENGFGRELRQDGAALIAQLPEMFFDHNPQPSLLHGDLWGGNYAACDAQPVIYDPAVYFGDRETDLAMSRLFGGFGPEFYDAYEESWPLPAGSGRREVLYQLYHVLNHLNLFGRSYLARTSELLKSLLKNTD